MRDRRGRMPQRRHNDVRILAQGTAFFPAMDEAIAAARSAVALELYWMDSGPTATRFIDALTAAANRGVAVFVLIDGYGSTGLGATDRRRLTEAGVALAVFNPLRLGHGRANLSRDHRKLLLIDDRRAFVGGAGVAEAFAGDAGWRETMLELRGECVADWWAVFAANWPARDAGECPRPEPHATGNIPATVLAGGPGLRHHPIKARALKDIARARQRVWMTTPYFLPSVKLRRALVRAARRGAAVRLLLPGPQACDLPAVQAAGCRYYDRLLRRGVRIFEYGGRVTHQKILLADHRAMIGSSNLDRWGLRWHLEASQAVESPELAARLANMLAGDCADSRERKLADWRRRTLVARVRERFWGRIEARAAAIAYRARLANAARERGDEPP